ncbi:FMRFamide receptor-like [Brachionus plicatilis]|uniref:FMRFamide receptor-like n=1 Tax=Brachionus plicatilis TaxID=10195 RepID=A0A3M7QBB6_BRAPC|nr:FMRFamide receptor-like [Brachionus plicatilis]
MLLETVIPIILILGTASNVVNFYVFTRPVLNGLTTFRFLAYLSMIDFCYLIVGLPHILSNVYFNYDFRDHSNLVCSLHSFFTYYLSHLSSNILAGVGVFRCVTLTSLRPMKPNSYLKANRSTTNLENKFSRRFSASPSFEIVESKGPRKSFLRTFIADYGSADKVVLAMMLVIFLFDFHFLIWMRLSKMDYSLIYHNASNMSEKFIKCYPSPKIQPIYSEFYTKAYHWIDLFLYSYIPFTIMIICTVLIIYRLFQINKKLNLPSPRPKQTKSGIYFPKVETKSEKDLDEVNTGDNKTRYKVIKKSFKIKDIAKKRTKKNNQIYKLLLTLNICFFVFVTPLVLSNTLGLLDYLRDTRILVFEVVYILAYLNHSMNFLFYLLSCEIYRNIIFEFFQ